MPGGRDVELSTLAGERTAFSLDGFERAGDWADYVKGVAWSLTAAGVPVGGLRGVLGSTLPTGAGLSSSAALEVAAAWALTGSAPPVEPMQLARLAQRAENEYVGVQSGLMDQFASALGVAGSAVLLDCRVSEQRSEGGARRALRQVELFEDLPPEGRSGSGDDGAEGLALIKALGGGWERAVAAPTGTATAP